MPLKLFSFPEKNFSQLYTCEADYVVERELGLAALG